MHRLDYWLVAGGGALGSVARFWLSGVIGRRFGETFPYGTLLVNVSGCLVIGFFAAYTGPEGRLLVRPEWRLAFMAGVCGGYTTFSSFSLQTLNLTMEGDWLRAAANVILSVVLCLGAVWLGQLCAAAISRSSVWKFLTKPPFFASSSARAIATSIGRFTKRSS